MDEAVRPKSDNETRPSHARMVRWCGMWGTYELPVSADLPIAIEQSGFRASRRYAPAHIYNAVLSRWFGSVLLLYTRTGGIYRVYLSASLRHAVAWITARILLLRLGARKIPFREFRSTLRQKNQMKSS